MNWEGKGRPPIMLQRNSRVDQQYRWDPKADENSPLSAMKPHFRRVQQFEVDKIGLEDAVFDEHHQRRVCFAVHEAIREGAKIKE